MDYRKEYANKTNLELVSRMQEISNNHDNLKIEIKSIIDKLKELEKEYIAINDVIKSRSE